MRKRLKGAHHKDSSSPSGLTPEVLELRVEETTTPGSPEEVQAAVRLLASLLLRGAVQPVAAHIPLDVAAPPKVGSSEE
jgi:hypothetical protein